jgi:hypothetical protein
MATCDNRGNDCDKAFARASLSSRRGRRRFIIDKGRAGTLKAAWSVASLV